MKINTNGNVQSYDGMIWADTNEICFQCKRCVQEDPDEMCVWHRSKGTVLVPGSIVSCCSNSKGISDEGSYKILRCPKFVPDESEDFTEMSAAEYQSICEDLPDILFQVIRQKRDDLYKKGEQYNAIEKMYKKTKKSLDAVAYAYDISEKKIEQITKAYTQQKHLEELGELEYTENATL